MFKNIPIKTHKEANLTLQVNLGSSVEQMCPATSFPMLHHQPSVSGEEYFNGSFFIYMRSGNIDLHVSSTICINFSFHMLRSIHMKFIFYWPNGF